VLDTNIGKSDITTRNQKREEMYNTEPKTWKNVIWQLATNTVISHELGQDRIVITTNG